MKTDQQDVSADDLTVALNLEDALGDDDDEDEEFTDPFEREAIMDCLISGVRPSFCYMKDGKAYEVVRGKHIPLVWEED